MLKRKLTKAQAASSRTNSKNSTKINREEDKVVEIWEQIYNTELLLNSKLAQIQMPPGIKYIYNPVEYAQDIHKEYLKKYANGSKRLIILGMNPGPHGMGQTGVPFGNISTVKDLLKLEGNVNPPEEIHPKRPVTGLAHKIDEQSGKRLWPLLAKLSNDSIDQFARQCLVYNFCPLIYYDRQGKNITPNELKGSLKNEVRNVCLGALEDVLKLLKTEIIVAVGVYVFNSLQESSYCRTKRIIKLPHPSPRTLYNHNWNEKAEKVFQDENLLEYFLDST